MTKFNSRGCAVLASLLTMVHPALGYEAPLSETTVREAYFLGQRNDETMARFLDTYAIHLPPPKTGPYIAKVQVLTPFAQVVDVSRQRTSGYSAQQAAIDYRARRDTIRLLAEIQLTATYGPFLAQPPKERSGAASGVSLRPSDFWKDFQIRFSQGDDAIAPRNVHGEPTYMFSEEGGATLSGAIVWEEFDAREVKSDQATVEIDTPDGQRVVVEFDLTKLR